MLCDYGCNQEANYKFKNGKKCCSKSVNKCKGKISKQILSQAGIPLSDKTRKRMSESHKERHRKNPELRINAITAMTKARIGKARPDLSEDNRKNKIYQTQEKNPNWRGGISFGKVYCANWRELTNQLKEYYKHCQNPRCTTPSKRLTTHHIDYNKKNCLPGNLIVLCNSCNIKANYNRALNEKYYRELKEAQNSNQV
jgi:hypothetical protein